MKRKAMLFLLSALLIPLLAVPVYPVELKQSFSDPGYAYGNLDVSVRLTGGKGAVLKAGRDIRMTFQVNKDAYVIIYNIDSEGFVNLLFPMDGKPKMVEGQKVYFLPEEGSGIHWEAGNTTGIEYIHVLAIDDRTLIRDDELLFLKQNALLEQDRRIRIEVEPFTAFNMIDEMIVIDAKENPPATDHTYFYINREVDYPRFLCSKCHGTDKFSDPYEMECPEVVIEEVEYDGKVGYPYPELYTVRHVDEIEDDYYIATDYGEITAEEWGYDDYSYDDTGNTKLYLTVNYRDAYPYYNGYWPNYSFYAGYSWPFWWDSWWWGWGWGSTWGCNYPSYYCHYYPFYSWYYPNYCYWDYCYRGGYGGYYSNYCYYDCVPAYYPRRGITKRSLSYASTTRNVRQRDTIRDSRLMRTRNEKARNRYYDTMKARNVSRGTTGSSAFRYNGRVRSRDDVTRRMVHGYDKARRNLRETREAYKTRGTSRKRYQRDAPSKSRNNRDKLYSGERSARRYSESARGKSDAKKTDDRKAYRGTRHKSDKNARSKSNRESRSSKSTSARKKSSSKSSPSRKSSSGSRTRSKSSSRSKSKATSTKSSSSSRRTISSGRSSARSYSPASRSGGARSSGGGSRGGGGRSGGSSRGGGGGRRR